METTIFLLDAIAITVLVFTSLQNDKKRPGDQQTGLFRYSQTRRAEAAKPKPDWVKEDQN